MRTVRYNKLVRDRIPEIIAREGRAPKTKILSLSQYPRFLVKKITEEAREFAKQPNIEEAIDMLEIIHAWLAVNGVDERRAAVLRRQKNRQRGAFHKRILLTEASAPRI